MNVEMVRIVIIEVRVIETKSIKSETIALGTTNKTTDCFIRMIQVINCVFTSL